MKKEIILTQEEFADLKKKKRIIGAGVDGTVYGINSKWYINFIIILLIQ